MLVLFILSVPPFLFGSCREYEAPPKSDTGKESRSVLEKITMWSHRPNIERIVKGLASDDPTKRDKALARLERLTDMGLTLKEGQTALRAATRSFPPCGYEEDEAAHALIAAASERPRRKCIPLVVELFPKYKPDAKWLALELLTRLPYREAATTFMALAMDYGQDPDADSLPIHELDEDPRFPEVFFPKILELAENPKLEMSIYLLALSYLQKRLIGKHDLSEWIPQLLRSYRRDKGKLLPAQKSHGTAWMWEPDYEQWRRGAAICLDIMGYLPSAEVERELQEALLIKDPRLQFYAVRGLLKQGKEVDRQVILAVAGSDEVRNWLYACLSGVGKLSLYPKQYRTQEAFARCALVQWLVYPTELGRVPDEIELMKVHSEHSEGPEGILDTYLFRFRSNQPNHWGKQSWMAGISGPYARKDSPTIESIGTTFSAFDAWDERSPDGHVRHLRGNVEEYWKARAKTLTE
ncbi:hypothetical protein ACFL2Q_09430 [Thermodesulfobacteriota bacterium]